MEVSNVTTVLTTLDDSDIYSGGVLYTMPSTAKANPTVVKATQIRFLSPAEHTINSTTCYPLEM